LDCSTGQYALFSLFYKKGVDGFYPSTPNIIEPIKNGILRMLASENTIFTYIQIILITSCRKVPVNLIAC
ncbi:hypothetical protein EFS12_00390, partial [Levilactobacillus brevis]|nr:hypothetical protein [Levilactobacillus brevis]MCT3586660.1 hypothetical protein [Levilactobacillus brevis]